MTTAGTFRNLVFQTKTQQSPVPQMNRPPLQPKKNASSWRPAPAKGRKKAPVPTESDLPLPPPHTHPSDAAALETWVYPGCALSHHTEKSHILTIPVNKPQRRYQQAMVQTCFYYNTLICLPTGLGKTFIAAVVMGNYFRWFPESNSCFFSISGKIVFLAPTRPLVAQQQKACLEIMGLPPDKIVHLVGKQPEQRKSLWQQNRIIFCTSQSLGNDLTEGVVDPHQLALVVIDEAHNAQGNHSYCQTVRKILTVSNEVRIVGLTATPGGTAKDVQAVISNLMIARVEVRDREDVDVAPYLNEVEVEKISVPLYGVVEEATTCFVNLVKGPIQTLIHENALHSKNITDYSAYELHQAAGRFRTTPGTDSGKMMFLSGEFTILESLYRAFEQLSFFGLSAMKASLEKFRNNDNTSRAKKRILLTAEWYALQRFIETHSSQASHPKMTQLTQILGKHFQGNPADTRVIVFGQFRQIVGYLCPLLSVSLLSSSEPLVRPFDLFPL
jgi:Fanconi anemia group M protein